MVAGDRRRPATSNAAETVMGSPPNRTADRARGSTSAGRAPEESRWRLRLSLRPGDAQAGRLSAGRPALVRGGGVGGVASTAFASASCPRRPPATLAPGTAAWAVLNSHAGAA